MKEGLVFSIKRFAVHDGIGIRTTIFLKGCALKCQWCHNPEGISSTSLVWRINSRCINCGLCVEQCKDGALYYENNKVEFDISKCTKCGKCIDVCPTKAMEWDSKKMSTEEVMTEIKKDMKAYNISGGGITISGGDPLFSQKEFALEILKSSKENGIHTMIESCLWTDRDTIDRVKQHVDEFIVDLKIFDENEHIKYTGKTNQVILSNIEYLSKTHKITIRIPMIPGVNTNQYNIEESAKFLSKLENVRVELIPFNKYYKTKYYYLGILPEYDIDRNQVEYDSDQYKCIFRKHNVQVI